MQPTAASIHHNPSFLTKFWIRFDYITGPIYFYLQESGIANSYFNERNLMQTVINLFGAGTDTTAATLRWGLLFMAKNPKIQGKKLKGRVGNVEKLARFESSK